MRRGWCSRMQSKDTGGQGEGGEGGEGRGQRGGPRAPPEALLPASWRRQQRRRPPAAAAVALRPPRSEPAVVAAARAVLPWPEMPPEPELEPEPELGLELVPEQPRRLRLLPAAAARHGRGREWQKGLRAAGRLRDSGDEERGGGDRNFTGQAWQAPQEPCCCGKRGRRTNGREVRTWRFPVCSCAC